MKSYIYIDESGNLGMNDKNNYFIISALKIPNDKELIKAKRILKKIRQRKLKNCPELKFSNTPYKIRKEILMKISQLNVEVHSVIINKKFTKNVLHQKLPTLYSFLIKILLEKTLNTIENKELRIILDRCMNKSQRDNFETYVNTEFLELFSELPKVIIEHNNSENEGCLQLVDFVSGAFGYKYNYKKLNDSCEEYTDLFRNIIITEKNDLFK